jgi:hypothetical protein
MILLRGFPRLYVLEDKNPENNQMTNTHLDELISELMENNFASLYEALDPDHPQDSLLDICTAISLRYYKVVNYKNLFDEITHVATQATIYTILKHVLFKLPEDDRKISNLDLIKHLTEPRYREQLIRNTLNYLLEMYAAQISQGSLADILDILFGQLSLDEKSRAIDHVLEICDNFTSIEEPQQRLLMEMANHIALIEVTRLRIRSSIRLISIIEKFQLPPDCTSIFFSIKLLYRESKNPIREEIVAGLEEINSAYTINDDIVLEESFENIRLSKLREINKLKNKPSAGEIEKETRIFNDEINLDEFEDDDFGEI